MGRPRGRNASGRATRRTRPGGKRGASRNASRNANRNANRGDSKGVSITSPNPVGNISGSSPTVRATVLADQSTLSKSDISVSLDGHPVERFQYHRTTGRLAFSLGKLASGAHTVEVSAGGNGNARKSWSFVVK